MELAGKVSNVVLGHLSGMDVILDGEVLSRQAEGVVADGEQHIIAVHPLLPGDHVHGGVGPGMAHMQAGGGGVGELYQAVELGLGGVAVLAGEGLFLLPPALPLLFDGCEIVLQINHTFLYFCAGVNPPAGIRINSVILYPKISMIARAAPPFFRVRLPEEMIKKFSSLFQKILIFSLLPLRIHPVS